MIENFPNFVKSLPIGSDLSHMNFNLKMLLNLKGLQKIGVAASGHHAQSILHLSGGFFKQNQQSLVYVVVETTANLHKLHYSFQIVDH